jgi:hypothetical protein
MLSSIILEVVNPISRIAASIRNEILMMTSVLRLKFNFLNNQKLLFISSLKNNESLQVNG